MARRRTFLRSEGYSERELLLAGSHHVVAAAHLYESASFMDLDSAGYLSHLGLELVLKAIVLYVLGCFTDEHHLTRLVATIRAQGLDLALTEEELSLVNRLDHFFELRYPNPSAPVSIETDDGTQVLKLFLRICEGFPQPLRSIVDHLRDPGPDGFFHKGGRVFLFKKGENDGG